MAFAHIEDGDFNDLHKSEDHIFVKDNHYSQKFYNRTHGHKRNDRKGGHIKLGNATSSSCSRPSGYVSCKITFFEWKITFFEWKITFFEWKITFFEWKITF
jgi:hypothetical protein